MRTITTRTGLLRAGLALWNRASWSVAAMALISARYTLTLVRPETQFVIQYVVATVILQIVIGLITKLYRGRHGIASFEESALLALIALGIGLVLGILSVFFTTPDYPRVVTFIVPLAALVLMAAGRFLFHTVSRFIQHHEGGEPVLVYGADNAGQQLRRPLAYDPDVPYEVVGYIGDDLAKSNLHVQGAKVLGKRGDMASIAQAHGINKIIVAIPTADRTFIREISELADETGLETLVMPSTKDLVSDRVGLGDLYQLNVTGLLGRVQIKTNLGEIADYLSGKMVLVTGAGGSIGSELARQLHRFGPKELVMLDRDGSGLHGTRLSTYNQGLLDIPNMVLYDTRDVGALNKVFANHRPGVVFHAVALKHLPILGQYPLEGWKTNTVGTLNVLCAFEKYGVQCLVNISTDKAANATSVLSKTKHLAEELTTFYAGKTDRTWLSVWSGNVLGSRGSMLHTFIRQIEQGDPVTITHPEITRYSMIIPEVYELTIQTGAIGRPADVLVFDMGEPMRILDVAKDLIKRSGKGIRIIFTGLRPNEKMHEVLLSDDEDRTPTIHEMISRVNIPALDPELLETVDGSDPESLSRLIHQRNAKEAARIAEEQAHSGLDEINLERPGS